MSYNVTANIFLYRIGSVYFILYKLCKNSTESILNKLWKKLYDKIINILYYVQIYI